MTLLTIHSHSRTIARVDVLVALAGDRYESSIQKLKFLLRMSVTYPYERFQTKPLKEARFFGY